MTIANEWFEYHSLLRVDAWQKMSQYMGCGRAQSSLHVIKDALHFFASEYDRSRCEFLVFFYLCNQFPCHAT
jgi:hypothetical protein